MDDRCALEVVDDTYRMISPQVDTGVYKLTRRRRMLSIGRLEQKEEYEPIAGLLQSDCWSAAPARSDSGQIAHRVLARCRLISSQEMCSDRCQTLLNTGSGIDAGILSDEVRTQRQLQPLPSFTVTHPVSGQSPLVAQR